MPKCLTKAFVSLHYYDEKVKKKGSNPKMTGNCNNLYGNCSNLRGECSGLRGECSNLRGECTGLLGNLNKITIKERKEHPDISYWIKE